MVLAPDSFDPSLDAVLRCAAQLSRVRRLVGGWLDPRARAVRVLLDGDEEGRMRYSLGVPERALPAVRSALGVFDRVSSTCSTGAEPGEAAKREEAGEGGSGEVVRAELRLARPSSEPLAHLPLDPDPLQSFARVLAGLDHTHGERAEVAVDLLPCDPGDSQASSPSAAQAGPPSRAPTAERRRVVCSGAWSVGRPVGPPAGGGDGRGAAAEREEIGAKLLQAEPLFGLQILVRCKRRRRAGPSSACRACWAALTVSRRRTPFASSVCGLLGLAFPGRISRAAGLV